MKHDLGDKYEHLKPPRGVVRVRRVEDRFSELFDYLSGKTGSWDVFIIFALTLDTEDERACKRMEQLRNELVMVMAKYPKAVKWLAQHDKKWIRGQL